MKTVFAFASALILAGYCVAALFIIAAGRSA